MNTLILHRTGPGTTVQDLGREGYLAQGLSRGGAADPVALAEGAALLNQPPSLAALEVISTIEVEITAPTWIAFTGAPKQASRDGENLAWNASHQLMPGQRLRLGAASKGNFAYLHLAGGIDTVPRVGGRGAHMAAGLGAPLSDGTRLPLGNARDHLQRSQSLLTKDRFEGGGVRMLPGPQTRLFPPEVLERFLATSFTRTAWGNRQAVKLGHEGEGFRPAEGLNLVSEVIVPGDIQVSGDGTPYVLGPECQTIGGYPRIGTVIPADLPMVMQATPGAGLRFRLVDLEEALSSHQGIGDVHQATLHTLREQAQTPYEKLMDHNLISGVAIDIFDIED